MTRTHVLDEAAILVSNRTSCYHLDEGALHVAPHADLCRLVGSTGLFTTARDLLLWEQDFANPRVGDRSLVAAMQMPTVQTCEATSNEKPTPCPRSRKSDN